MNQNDKPKLLVIYDFCGTIADFQTGNAFVRYVIRKKDIAINRYERLRCFLVRTGFIKRFNYIFSKMPINKALLLYQIKGISYKELDEFANQYYIEIIKPHLIKKIIDTIKRYQSEDAVIVVDSAGYAIYLKYFVEEFNIPILFASEFEYKSGVFTGRIIGKDNSGEEKVRRLNEHFGSTEFKSRFTSVIGYTDSSSDMPLLKLCDKVVCVNKGNDPERWMLDIGAEIICY